MIRRLTSLPYCEDFVMQVKTPGKVFALKRSVSKSSCKTEITGVKLGSLPYHNKSAASSHRVSPAFSLTGKGSN